MANMSHILEPETCVVCGGQCMMIEALLKQSQLLKNTSSVHKPATDARRREQSATAECIGLRACQNRDLKRGVRNRVE